MAQGKQYKCILTSESGKTIKKSVLLLALSLRKYLCIIYKTNSKNHGKIKLWAVFYSRLKIKCENRGCVA